MSFWESAKQWVDKAVTEGQERKKKAENERKMQMQAVAEVERLSIFCGRRQTSRWVSYAIAVTPKNADRVMERIQDANKRINRVIVPDEYREAWEELAWYMTHLAAIEGKIHWRSERPSQMMQKMKMQYNACLFEWLDRYAAYHWKKEIEPLKTEKGKLNRAKNFLPGLDDMWGNMTEAAQRYAEKLASREVERIHKLYQ